ncbi:MAG: hypothetical protein KDC35_02790 [Acidobacteria bacterium]|nr:hypothetical protein [Acidobacteriota bacterium]
MGTNGVAFRFCGLGIGSTYGDVKKVFSGIEIEVRPYFARIVRTGGVDFFFMPSLTNNEIDDKERVVFIDVSAIP